jgi:hypothetical protein
MDYHEIKNLIGYPAVDLLRSDNAPMVLGFLFRAFKAHHRAVLPEGQIRSMLEAYLEELRESEPDRYTMSAAQYLALWCDNSHQYLRKYLLEGSPEPLFELTDGSEKALLWMEQLSGTTGFVGTESRLDSIFKGLDDLLRNTTTDVNVRVRQLESDMARIQEEIDRIRTTGVVPTYKPVQINERFAQLVSTARELMGDFRLVEHNLKRIAQAIAEQHAKPDVTKGSILGEMLDAEEALRKSEQGQSFYAFWELLLSGERQQQFQEALEKVLSLPDLHEKLRTRSLLNQLIEHLLIEGEKVLDSGERMATNLRRVLDSRRAADRAKVGELIHDIQGLAITLRPDPPEGTVCEVQEFGEFFNSMSRPLWEQPAQMNLLGQVEVADNQISKEDLKAFSNLPHISLNRLRKNVKDILDNNQTQTLEHVLGRFPPKYGMLEVLGYLLLAMDDPRHYVGDDDQIIIVPGPKPTKWRVPCVLFCK